MALDLSAKATMPWQDTITLSATPGKVTMVTIPVGTSLRARARTTEIKVVLGEDVTQTDDVDLGAADYATVDPDQWVEITDGSRRGGFQQRTVYYFASTTASQVIELWLARGAA